MHWSSRAGRWIRNLALGLGSAACLGFAADGFAATRGVTVTLKASEASGADDIGSVRLYGASYALVVGIDAYRDPAWPRLSNAVLDARRVAAELEAHGFEVTLKTELDGNALSAALKDFFIRKGREPDSRLFVWFAGHGHTLNGEGFLVPSDGASPTDEVGFLSSAISLRDFGKFVRYANSKHVYAVFDSCFAGTIFNVARSRTPPAITRVTTEPVREFLSSGDAGQQVSDDGRFARMFVEALEGRRRADANGDGYLTASEMGAYLTYEIANLSENRQTPRYGKLTSDKFDKGDFVFVLPGAAPRPAASQPSDAPSAEVAFWQSIQGSRNPQVFEEFLRQFPEGRFAGLARIRLGEIGGGADAEPDAVTVRDVQGRLAALGYLSGAVDGVMGPQTREAIVAYQRDAGLDADGRATGALRDRLAKAPGPLTRVLDFDSLDTDEGVVKGPALKAYLGRFGVKLADVTPDGSEVHVANDGKDMSVIAASRWNFLEQGGGAGSKRAFTLRFDPPLLELRFTRTAYYGATKSGLVYPAWSAVAKDAAGGELDSVHYGPGPTYRPKEDPEPAKTFTLKGPGIASVTFSGDHLGYAGRGAATIDDLALVQRLPDPARGARAGDVFRDCPECPEMVVVPAGSFRMGDAIGDGDASERPVHAVRIAEPFAVGRYEVTQAEWRAVTGINHSQFKGDRHPVEQVSWNQAQRFVKWLSGLTGRDYRLLSEAEWEYVARAGTKTAFALGDRLSAGDANVDGQRSYNGSPLGEQRWKTVAVGGFAPNGFGLFDLHGNVWEWVQDCWNRTYDGAPTDGRAWLDGQCHNRVARGGDWMDGPWSARSSARKWESRDVGYPNFGFRVARSLDRAP